MKRSLFKQLLLMIILFCFLFENGFAQQKGNSSEIEKLLSRINLPENRLEQITLFAENPEKSAKELLNYYKNRTAVKHPINLTTKKEIVTDKDLKWANDALQHIFVGQPAYPSHFCGEDIDWSSRPVPDNEWVWQLNRMYFWNSMAKVYAKIGDEKYAKEWCEQLIDWTRKNPNNEDHKYAWRSIETGIRGYNWTGLYHQFIQSPHFTPEVLVAFLNSMYDHAEFLMTEYRSRSNWGLMEAEGMAFIAINFPEFVDSEKWKTEAFRRLNNEINIQVYPDGHQRELAMGYHLGCIRWFFRTYELAKLNGIENAFPESYLEMIELMCEVPMKLCLPDGTNAQFGDAWAGTPGQHSDKFLEWSKQFARHDFLYLATEGEQGIKPNKTAFALKESGLYSLRSSWDKDAICLVLKCGPDGGGHSQPDNGTFALYAGGRNLMPDAGSYIYSGNPEGRKWFRQTKVHQTLTLNGEDTKYAPKLLKWQPGENLDLLVVENAGYENLTHRRSVFFVDKKYFIIVDEAIGTGIGDVDIHFQLAPGDAVFNDKEFSVKSDFKEGWNVFVQTQKQNGLELTEEEGWVSFVYTKKEPRPAFRYRLKKENDSEQIRFVTVVAPFEKEIPNIKVEIVGDPKIGSSILQFKIDENGMKKIIGYSL
ncbi:MAG: alginate lyase family protein [Prolixibacteraceae bacterium]|nr:alginate lyase family protein [Prolixibacteraceae bacterium]